MYIILIEELLKEKYVANNVRVKFKGTMTK